MNRAEFALKMAAYMKGDRSFAERGEQSKATAQRLFAVYMV